VKLAGCLLLAVIAVWTAVYLWRVFVPVSDFRIIGVTAAVDAEGQLVQLEGRVFCVRDRLSFGPTGPAILSELRPWPRWWGKVLPSGRVLVFRHPRALCATPDGPGSGLAPPVARLVDPLIGRDRIGLVGQWVYMTPDALTGGEGPVRLFSYAATLLAGRASRWQVRHNDPSALMPRDAMPINMAPRPTFSLKGAAFVIPVTQADRDFKAEAREWPLQSARYVVNSAAGCVPGTSNHHGLWGTTSQMEELDPDGPATRPVHLGGPNETRLYDVTEIRAVTLTAKGWVVAADGAPPLRIEPVAARANPVITGAEAALPLILPDGLQAPLTSGALIWDHVEARAYEVFGPFPACP